MPNPPTKSQLRVLGLIAKLRHPTLRELAAEYGCTCHAAQCFVESLGHRGLVTWEPDRARTLRLTAEGRRVLAKGGPIFGRFIPVTKCGTCGVSRIGAGACPERRCAGVVRAGGEL